MNKLHPIFLVCLFLLNPIEAATHANADAEMQFNFATGLLIKNEYALAADEFDALLRDHPAFPQADVALYRLGEARQKAGDATAARTAFERLLKDFPKTDRAPQAHYWLAQILAPNAPADAAKMYETVAAQWPDNPLAEAAAYGAVENYFKAEEWKKAIETSNTVIEKFPQSKHIASALYSRGWSAFRLEDWELARGSFATLVERHPDGPYAAASRERMAQALRHLGRVDEARARFAELAKRDDTIGQDAAISHASLLFERGDFADAAQAFELAAKRLPGDARQPACWLNAGNAWFAARDFAKAATAFEHITRDHAADALAPQAAYWLGQARLRGGDAPGALAVFAPLLQRAPSPEIPASNLHLLMAEAQMSERLFEKAARSYAAARAAEPAAESAAQTWFSEMAAWEKAGRADQAEQAAKGLLAAFPQYERANEARFWLGEFCFRREALDEAQAALERFVKDAPKHALAPEAHYKLGWCARKRERHQAAATHFGTVYRDWPQHALAAESALRAGEAFEALGGHAEQAAAAYASARELAPDGDTAPQAAIAQLALMIERKQFEEALTLADKLIATKPKSELLSYAQLYRATSLEQLNRHAEAATAFEQIAAQQSQSKSAGGKTSVEATGTAQGAQAARTEFLAAQAWERAGDWLKARQAYARAAAKAEEPALRFEAAYREARSAIEAKDTATAEQLLAKLIEGNPPEEVAALALYDLAWLLADQDKQADAEQRFAELVKRYPQHRLASDAHFRLGEFAYARNDFAAAAPSYEAALKSSDPNFVNEVRYRLGWTYEQLGRADDAQAAFAALVAAQPDSPHAMEARYRQARLLEDKGLHDRALAALEAVQDGDFAKSATLLRGEIHRAKNDHRKALDAYAQVQKSWPDSSEAIAALLGQGHSSRALEAYADALDAYAKVILLTRDERAAQAALGQGYCHFARKEWDAAAKAFLKVDILYGYENLKPEALRQLSATWEAAGDAEKATRYRNELAQRYPEAK